MSDQWLERTWRPYGVADPYYAVLAEDRYRKNRFDDTARREFFKSGEEHIAWVLSNIRRSIDPEFTPTKALDFGCGVGRLVLPLSRIAREVVGADVSPTMLAEAQRNVDEAGASNVKLVLSDDSLQSHGTGFDLVHSYIVIQHIPPERGEAIFMGLADKLKPGGVGALHVTYAREAPTVRKVVHQLRKSVPGVNAVVNLAQGQRAAEPMIPMFNYKLENILEGLRERGCESVHMLLTDHGGHHGVMVLFQVAKDGPRRVP
jgi:ubiquinone/menaquinone biosynthesis C-methylase UbiE